jgi:multidrug efflux pump subunit AcrA (membrane-fusion protein)
MIAMKSSHSHQGLAGKYVSHPVFLTLLATYLLPTSNSVAQSNRGVGSVYACPEAAAITKPAVSILAQAGMSAPQTKGSIQAAVSNAVKSAPYAAPPITVAAMSAATGIPVFSNKIFDGGRVTKILVKKGSHVSAGQVIALIEVNGITVKYTASISGTISDLAISEGKVLTSESLIAIIKTENPELIAAIIFAAVAAAPAEALAITTAAIFADPSQSSAITDAAIAAAPSQAEAIQAAANQALSEIGGQTLSGNNTEGANAIPTQGINPVNVVPPPSPSPTPPPPVPNPTATPVSPHQ